MTQAFTGGCACGAIRYEIAAEPIMAGHCKCRACQRDSGTGHASHLMFPKAAARILGEASRWDSRADSGNAVTRAFCPTCGAPVFSLNAAMPDAVFVRAASLDDPGRFQPQMVVWASAGPAWDSTDPALPHFQQMPPMGGG
jgi:hypothetical protein